MCYDSQQTDMKGRGHLQIKYGLEDCKGSSGQVCIASVYVEFSTDGESESVNIDNDNVVTVNGQPHPKVGT